MPRHPFEKGEKARRSGPKTLMKPMYTVPAQDSRTNPTTIKVLPRRIPRTLRERRQWVSWRYEERGNKRTKVPYSPGTNNRAQTTDLMSWGTFQEALSAYEEGMCEGIGFVFCSADPFVGIDLDRCRDPETGEIDAWAQKVLNRFTQAVLIDVSPSGKGVHVITRGSLRVGAKSESIEIYGQGRFFAVTGVAP